MKCAHGGQKELGKKRMKGAEASAADGQMGKDKGGGIRWSHKVQTNRSCRVSWVSLVDLRHAEGTI